MHLTVIPGDQLIIKNSKGLKFDFKADDKIHVIQWKNDSGWIEFNDLQPNHILGEGDFVKCVKVFSDLFDAEQARLDSCPGDAYEWNQDKEMWVYNYEKDCPGDGCVLIEGRWRRLIFTKKQFLAFCGMPMIMALNNAIKDGQVLVKTVYDFLLAADYVDIKDPQTIEMLKLLAGESSGHIVSAEELNRLLSGQEMCNA